MIFESMTSLIDYISENVDLFANIVIGGTSREDKSIGCNILPSVNQKFYAGRRSKELRFRIMSRSSDQAEALRTLEAIADTLEDIDVDVNTEPNLVSRDEKGYLYTAIFTTVLDP